MPEEKLQTLSLQVINAVSWKAGGRRAVCSHSREMSPWPRMPLVGTGSSAEHSGPGFTVILHDGTFCLRPQTAQLC